jgi:hypothetical protein
MRKFYLISSLLLCSLYIYPQFESSKQENKRGQQLESQYDNFKKTFDKEFGEDDVDVDKQKTKAISHLPPAELPEWIFDFGDFSTSGSLLVFGISDPGLDSILAIEQARVRALGLLSIFSGATIQNITDVYSSEMTHDAIVGKFTSFSKIISPLSFRPDQLKIFKHAFNTYGEAVVIAGFEEAGINTADINGQVVADYFLSEEGEYDDLFVYSKYNFDIEGRGFAPSAFTCSNTKKSIQINSYFDGHELVFDYGRFKYFLAQEITITEEELLNYSYAGLSDGLWNAYISAILRQIEMHEKHTSEIKRMGDQYAGEFQTLTREISNLRLSFELSGIFVKDNLLYLKITSR